MDESFALIGHELRNMLGTFLGFTELLISEEWSRAQQLEYLHTMRDEGLRIQRFMQQLFDLEGLRAGELPLHTRPTDIRQLLGYAAMIAAHDPTHPVVLDCPSSLPMALVEPDRIQQVLGNLLSNARKYTPGGGQITITARAVRQTLVISVQDSGVGIPKDAVARVFDKFYRVTSARHQGIPGTGLGLAISREIVAAHGGRIWVESDGLGQGARFAFSLPLAGVSRTEPPVVARSAPLIAKKNLARV
ncbi:MAG TPA: HAMP domain-containing sensor histidine kinase [Chloroflexota bacterium]|jgi:hypothetical protein|nr:HAMP domain-containing sensor histidine kinase [Chloroflexota bacterium]